MREERSIRHNFQFTPPLVLSLRVSSPRTAEIIYYSFVSPCFPLLCVGYTSFLSAARAHPKLSIFCATCLSCPFVCSRTSCRYPFQDLDLFTFHLRPSDSAGDHCYFRTLLFSFSPRIAFARFCLNERSFFGFTQHFSCRRPACLSSLLTPLFIVCILIRDLAFPKPPRRILGTIQSLTCPLPTVRLPSPFLLPFPTSHPERYIQSSGPSVLLTSLTLTLPLPFLSYLSLFRLQMSSNPLPLPGSVRRRP